jgi:hypothetical protein
MYVTTTAPFPTAPVAPAPTVQVRNAMVPLSHS